MALAGDAIVVMGEIVGSYGVRGWIRVRPFTEVPETLLEYPTWWVRPARGGAWREVRKVDGRTHSGELLAGLDGMDNREAALAMKGAEVGVPRSALPAARGDEIYWEDLTGLSVVNRAGNLLGVVSGMTEHGAHPLLKVTRPAGVAGPERLIPFVPAIVERVDVAARRIDVDWGEDY
jgi:16S rRNA processing protein RimM